MIVFVMKGDVAMIRTVVEAFGGTELVLRIAGDDLDRACHEDAQITPRVVVSQNGTGYPRVFVLHNGNMELAAYSVTPAMARQAIELNKGLARRARLEEATR